jgi:hypothetical protein
MFVLPLLLALNLQPTDLRLVEPLRLTNGIEVEAVYHEPSDSFCLAFSDFVMTRADIEGAVATIEEERRVATDRVRACSADCQATTKALHERADRLDAELSATRQELAQMARSRFWWRAGAVAVLSLSFVSAVVVVTR